MTTDAEVEAVAAARMFAGFYKELVKEGLPDDVVAEATSAFIQAWVQPSYEGE